MTVGNSILTNILQIVAKILRLIVVCFKALLKKEGCQLQIKMIKMCDNAEICDKTKK